MNLELTLILLIEESRVHLRFLPQEIPRDSSAQEGLEMTFSLKWMPLSTVQYTNKVSNLLGHQHNMQEHGMSRPIEKSLCSLLLGRMVTDGVFEQGFVSKC